MSSASEIQRQQYVSSAAKKAVLIFGGGFAALTALLFASLCFGEASISIQTVMEGLATGKTYWTII